VSAPVIAAGASDAPQRQIGTRTRSGNAMLRTRGNLLEATAHCVERYGVRRTTMGDIALKAVVAKATLYNHFRTKDDVLTALVDARCAAVAETCLAVAAGLAVRAPEGLGSPDLGRGLAAALRVAAAALAADGPLRRVVRDEPALAARLATPGDGRSWDAARARVTQVLEAAGAPADPPAVAVVLRWLCSQVLWPTDPAEAALAAELLEQGLTARAATRAEPDT
jgi:AcrR family transcriptional regulator